MAAVAPWIGDSAKEAIALRCRFCKRYMYAVPYLMFVSGCSSNEGGWSSPLRPEPAVDFSASRVRHHLHEAMRRAVAGRVRVEIAFGVNDRKYQIRRKIVTVGILLHDRTVLLGLTAHGGGQTGKLPQVAKQFFRTL